MSRMNDLPDTNPKTRFGTAKPGISSIPPIALLHCGRGMDDGMVKYGLMNWREHEVSASVYYNAAFRHMAAWYEGEQEASDSGVHHLGHVMACCAILLDAEAQGKLNDDRPEIPGNFGAMVAAMTRPFDDPDIPDAFDDLCVEFANYWKADVAANEHFDQGKFGDFRDYSLRFTDGKNTQYIPLRTDISKKEYREVIGPYLAQGGPHAIENFRAIRRAAGAVADAKPSKMQRTQIAFYVEVEMFYCRRNAMTDIDLAIMADLFITATRHVSERG